MSSAFISTPCGGPLNLHDLGLSLGQTSAKMQSMDIFKDIKPWLNIFYTEIYKTQETGMVSGIRGENFLSTEPTPSQGWRK